MSVRKLIKFFSTFSVIPVEIQDVVDQIVEEYKPVDKIVLKPVDVPPGDLLGVHYRYIERRDKDSDEIRREVLIPYSEHAPVPVQRLTCCKELIHILDAAAFRTKTKASVAGLVPRLLEPSNSAPIGVADLGAFKDRLATYQAASVLFPEEMREEFHTAYNLDRVTLDKVAEDVCLPRHIIEDMLSDDWLPIINGFADF